MNRFNQTAKNISHELYFQMKDFILMHLFELIIN
jgi:hypothetical protein